MYDVRTTAQVRSDGSGVELSKSKPKTLKRCYGLTALNATAVYIDATNRSKRVWEYLSLARAINAA